MPYDPSNHTGRLRRLDSSFYRGHTWVHWTITINQRQTGWLDDSHHLRVRELLCHTMARETLTCPAYCLMPDHAHFLRGGLKKESDQMRALRFFRTEWNRLLKNGRPPACLQMQAYDHVLTDAERMRGTFEKVAGYVFENPVRSALVNQIEDWPWLGAMVPGYPSLDPREDDYFPTFWKIYDRLINLE